MAQKLLAPDGTPVKYQNREVFSSELSGVVKSVNLERRTMIMTGTDETKDRDGDIIKLSGWELENYRKNPVFLWAHNYGSVPLARAQKVVKKREPQKMDFHLLYPTKGIYPFADMILELYDGKFINASSVGFIPLKWEDIEEEGEGMANRWRRGRMFTKQELLELSGCAVPSNPNALQDALKGKGFNYDPNDLIKWIMGQSLIPRPEKADDILDEILDKSVEVVEEDAPVQVQVPEKIENTPPESKPEEKKEEKPEENEYKHLLENLEDVEEKLFDLTQEDVLKPYPNEHACRIKQPNYDKYARKNCYRKHANKCVDYIFGIKSANKSELQALRFKKDVWTAAAAKEVCSGVGGSFEAAKEITLEELVGMCEELKTRVGAYEELKKKVEEIGDQLRSLADKVKDPAVSQANANGKSQAGATGEGAGSIILQESFAQNKNRVALCTVTSVTFA